MLGNAEISSHPLSLTSPGVGVSGLG
jgi:hypothetical protein